MYVTYFVLTLPYNLQCIVISLQSLSVEFMWFRREIMRFLWLRFKVKANLLSHPIIHTHSLSSDTHTYTHLTQHPTSHCMHPKLPFSTTHIHTHTHTPITLLSLDGKGRKTSIGSFLEHPLFYLKEVESTKYYDFSPSPALNRTHFHSIDLASCPRQNKIKYELVAVDSASLTGK